LFLRALGSSVLFAKVVCSANVFDHIKRNHRVVVAFCLVFEIYSVPQNAPAKDERVVEKSEEDAAWFAPKCAS
jgi:hypothetical protein